MDQEKREADRKNFVRLGTKRVNNAIKQIRLIGNLSNTSNYYYMDEDVEKIFKALQAELEDCRERFSKKKAKSNFSFGDES